MTTLPYFGHIFKTDVFDLLLMLLDVSLIYFADGETDN